MVTERMNYKTLNLDSYQYHASDATMISQDEPITQKDWHNLNGFGMSVATQNTLKELGHKLTFVLTRSHSAGSGAHTAHWTGDNNSFWSHLKLSIGQIFNFNIFSIPFVGADICGFGEDTTPELCARWMQAGALYPFARNHNLNESIA